MIDTITHRDSSGTFTRYVAKCECGFKSQPQEFRSVAIYIEQAHMCGSQPQRLPNQPHECNARGGA